MKAAMLTSTVHRRQRVADPSFPPAGWSAMPDDGPAPAPASTRRKVLVIDDEPDLADLTGALLCSHGLDARVAYSGLEALAVLEADPEIDAIFSDVMMPGMNGLQLAEVVGRLYPNVRIVLATGFTAPSLMETRGQPHPCIAKPYRIETVIALLASRTGRLADS